MNRVTAYAHFGSHDIGEVRRRLANVLLWQLFAEGLQSDLNLTKELTFYVGAEIFHRSVII